MMNLLYKYVYLSADANAFHTRKATSSIHSSSSAPSHSALSASAKASAHFDFCKEVIVGCRIIKSCN